MNTTDQVKASGKAASKWRNCAQRNLENLAEMRATLPKKQAALDAAREIADVRSDTDLARLARLQSEIQTIEMLLKTQPPRLAPDNEKLAESISALNDALIAAARAEREALIDEATRALSPFAGSKPEPGPCGDPVVPAREIAKTMPILGLVLHEGDARLSVPVASGREAEDYAAALILAADSSLAIATEWMKNGGKFARPLA